MLKMNNLLKSTIAVIALVGLTACDKFLDKMPDNRAEINSPEKILKVSQYDLLAVEKHMIATKITIHVGQRGQHG